MAPRPRRGAAVAWRVAPAARRHVTGLREIPRRPACSTPSAAIDAVSVRSTRGPKRHRHEARACAANSQFGLAEPAFRPDQQRQLARARFGGGRRRRERGAGARREYQASRGRRGLREPAGGLECRRRQHLGQAVAAALLAGRGDDDALPVFEPPPGAFAVELHDAALGRHRHDPRDAEFGGLLQHPVHLLAARQRLQQRHAQRRLALHRGSRRPDAQDGCRRACWSR